MVHLLWGKDGWHRRQESKKERKRMEQKVFPIWVWALMIANSFEIFSTTTTTPSHASTNHSLDIVYILFNFLMANPWERSHTLPYYSYFCCNNNNSVLHEFVVPHCFLGILWLECMSFAPHTFSVFCNLFNIFPRDSKVPDPEDVHAFRVSEYFWSDFNSIFYVFFMSRLVRYQLVLGFR